MWLYMRLKRITSESGFDEEEFIKTLKKSKSSDKKHAIVVITETYYLFSKTC